MLKENEVITYTEYENLNYNNDIQEIEFGSIPKSWDEFIRAKVYYTNGDMVNVRVKNPGYR